MSLPKCLFSQDLIYDTSVPVSGAGNWYWYVTPLYCPNNWTCLHILWEISHGSEYTREEKGRGARQSLRLIIFFLLFLARLYVSYLCVKPYVPFFCVHLCVFVCVRRARLWVTHPSACVTWDSGGDAGECANTWVEFVTKATGIQWVGAMGWLVQFY